MSREEDEIVEGPIVLPGNETITVSEEDKEPDEPEEKVAPVRDKKTGQWSEKKAARRNAIQENEEFRSTAKELRELVKGLEERSSRDMANLLAALRPQQQQTPAGPPPEVAALESQIEGIMAQQKAVLAEIAADKPGAEEKYYKLDRERLRLIARAEGTAQGWGKQQSQQQSQISPEHAARYAIIQQEFPEFHGHEKWSVASGAFRRGLMAAGHPDNLATDRLAIQMAAQQLGIGPKAAPPSQRTRQAYGAPPTAGRQANGKAPRSMEIPENLIKGSGLTRQQIAEALYEDE